MTFAINGLLFGSWVPRIPEVKAHLGLSSADLGLALLAPAVGALLSMRLTGAACARFGSARVTRLAMLGFGALCWAPGLAGNLPSLWFIMLIWGVVIGALDVAMNAQGVSVEHAYGRPVLSGFHATWSLGSLVGSLAGSAGAALKVPIAAQQAVLAGVLVSLALAAERWLIPDPPHETPPVRARRRLPDARLVLLGIAALFALMSEGAVADWSGVLLRDTLHVHAGQVGLAYAAFNLTMTLGRLVGDRVVHALGRVRTIATISLIGAVGLTAGLATHDLIGTVIGFALLGIGLSVMVPVLFSTAADGAAPGPAIGTVSSFGYTGFLVGPTAIGLIAQAASVPFALWMLPVFTAAGGGLGIAAVRMTRSDDRTRPAEVEAKAIRSLGAG